MASGAAFSVEAFVTEPTLSQLDNCRKVDLFANADHYGIQVSTSFLKKELKAAMVDGLVEGCVCSLPVTVAVAESIKEVRSEVRGAEVTELQQDILNLTPGVKHRDKKQFTLPRFEPSVETTPGSRIDAWLKLCLACLQLEKWGMGMGA